MAQRNDVRRLMRKHMSESSLKCGEKELNLEKQNMLDHWQV